MSGIKKGKTGLQPGMTSMDQAAKKIDKNLKSIRNELEKELSSIKELKMSIRLKKDTTKTACEPDGGAWFYKDILICAFEAKKQQDKGNVIERWYKNEYRCRKINSDISYVTFCRGEGAYPNGVIGKILDVAHDGEWNIYRPGKNSCWLSKDGFTRDFIKSKIKEIILERIDFINSKLVQAAK